MAQGGGEIGAGGIAGDGQAPRIDPQRPGVIDDPARGGLGVGQLRGMPVFGREAVVDRNHAAAAGRGEAARDAIVCVETAGDPAAAMKIDHAGRRRGTRGRRRVEAQRNLAAGPGRRELQRVAVDRGRRTRHFHQLRIGTPALVWIIGHRARLERREHGQQPMHMRIESARHSRTRPVSIRASRRASSRT